MCVKLEGTQGVAAVPVPPWGLTNAQHLIGVVQSLGGNKARHRFIPGLKMVSKARAIVNPQAVAHSHHTGTSKQGWWNSVEWKGTSAVWSSWKEEEWQGHSLYGYLKISPIVFSGFYFQVSMHRMTLYIYFILFICLTQCFICALGLCFIFNRLLFHFCPKLSIFLCISV